MTAQQRLQTSVVVHLMIGVGQISDIRLFRYGLSQYECGRVPLPTRCCQSRPPKLHDNCALLSGIRRPVSSYLWPLLLGHEHRRSTR